MLCGVYSNSTIDVYTYQIVKLIWYQQLSICKKKYTVFQLYVCIEENGIYCYNYCRILLLYVTLMCLEEEVAVVNYLCVLIELLHEVSCLLHDTLTLCCKCCLLVILYRTISLALYLEKIYTSESLYRMCRELTCLCSSNCT